MDQRKKIDPNKIGQDRTIQNPIEAERAAMGIYDDAVQRIDPADRHYPEKQYPMGPQKDPFKITGGAGGSR